MISKSTPMNVALSGAPNSAGLPAEFSLVLCYFCLIPSLKASVPCSNVSLRDLLAPTADQSYVDSSEFSVPTLASLPSSNATFQHPTSGLCPYNIYSPPPAIQRFLSQKFFLPFFNIQFLLLPSVTLLWGRLCSKDSSHAVR